MSQITGIVREYLLFNLPKEYFKSIHIDGAFRSVEEVRPSSEEHRDIRKENPSLAIQPSLRFDYMGGTHTTNHIMFQGNKQLYSNLRYMDVLFTDDTNLNYIRYENRRYKVNFDIEMRLESQMYCYDMLGYLKQRIPANQNFFINGVPLCIAIPNDIVAYLGNIYKKDINNATELRSLIDILDMKQIKPIDFKINPQSGNKTIQFIEKMNLLCKIEDDPQMAKNEIGRQIDNNTVTFTISAELSYPSLFVLLQYKDPEAISDKLVLEDNGQSVSLNYFVRIRPDYVLKDAAGNDTNMILQLHQQYLTEINQSVDFLPFDQVIDPSVDFYIEYVKKKDITILSNLNEFEFRVYEDGNFIPRTYTVGSTTYENWKVDWVNKTIQLFNPKKNYNYGVCLYINMKSMKPILESHQKYDRNVFDKIK